MLTSGETLELPVESIRHRWQKDIVIKAELRRKQMWVRQKKKFIIIDFDETRKNFTCLKIENLGKRLQKFLERTPENVISKLVEDSDRFFEEMIENIDKKCPQNYDEDTGKSNITDKSEDT